MKPLMKLSLWRKMKLRILSGMCRATASAVGYAYRHVRKRISGSRTVLGRDMVLHGAGRSHFLKCIILGFQPVWCYIRKIIDGLGRNSGIASPIRDKDLAGSGVQPYINQAESVQPERGLDSSAKKTEFSIPSKVTSAFQKNLSISRTSMVLGRFNGGNLKMHGRRYSYCCQKVGGLRNDVHLSSYNGQCALVSSLRQLDAKEKETTKAQEKLEVQCELCSSKKSLVIAAMEGISDSSFEERLPACNLVPTEVLPGERSLRNEVDDSMSIVDGDKRQREESRFATKINFSTADSTMMGRDSTSDHLKSHNRRHSHCCHRAGPDAKEIHFRSYNGSCPGSFVINGEETDGQKEEVEQATKVAEHLPISSTSNEELRVITRIKGISGSFFEESSCNSVPTVALPQEVTASEERGDAMVISSHTANAKARKRGRRGFGKKAGNKERNAPVKLYPRTCIAPCNIRSQRFSSVMMRHSIRLLQQKFQAEKETASCICRVSTRAQRRRQGATATADFSEIKRI